MILSVLDHFARQLKGRTSSKFINQFIILRFKHFHQKAVTGKG